MFQSLFVPMHWQYRLSKVALYLFIDHANCNHIGPHSID